MLLEWHIGTFNKNLSEIIQFKCLFWLQVLFRTADDHRLDLHAKCVEGGNMIDECVYMCLLPPPYNQPPGPDFKKSGHLKTQIQPSKSSLRNLNNAISEVSLFFFFFF